MTEYIEKWPVVNRLIDLENEFQQYKPFHGFEHAMYRKICEVEIAIGKTPDADVAPVRHGRWIKESDGGTRCSVCNKRVRNVTGGWYEPVDLSDMLYCPKCGAKMDETVGENER